MAKDKNESFKLWAEYKDALIEFAADGMTRDEIERRGQLPAGTLDGWEDAWYGGDASLAGFGEFLDAELEGRTVAYRALVAAARKGDVRASMDLLRYHGSQKTKDASKGPSSVSNDDALFHGVPEEAVIEWLERRKKKA